MCIIAGDDQSFDEAKNRRHTWSEAGLRGVAITDRLLHGCGDWGRSSNAGSMHLCLWCCYQCLPSMLFQALVAQPGGGIGGHEPEELHNSEPILLPYMFKFEVFQTLHCFEVEMTFTTTVLLRPQKLRGLMKMLLYPCLTSTLLTFIPPLFLVQ